MFDNDIGICIDFYQSNLSAVGIVILTEVILDIHILFSNYFVHLLYWSQVRILLSFDVSITMQASSCQEQLSTSCQSFFSIGNVFSIGTGKIVNPFLQCISYSILTWDRPSSCLPPLSCTQTPQSCRYTLRWFQAFSWTWSLVRTTPGPVPQSSLTQCKVYSRAGTRSSGSRRSAGPGPWSAPRQAQYRNPA